MLVMRASQPIRTHHIPAICQNFGGSLFVANHWFQTKNHSVFNFWSCFRIGSIHIIRDFRFFMRLFTDSMTAESTQRYKSPTVNKLLYLIRKLFKAHSVFDNVDGKVKGIFRTCNQCFVFRSDLSDSKRDCCITKIPPFFCPYVKSDNITLTQSVIGWDTMDDHFINRGTNGTWKTVKPFKRGNGTLAADILLTNGIKLF